MYRIINKGKIYSTIANIDSFFIINKLPEKTKSVNNVGYHLHYNELQNISFSLVKELIHLNGIDILYLLYTKKFDFYIIIHNTGVIKEKSKQLDLFE